VALFHVLKNAVEATARGGEISVQTRLDGERVFFSVEDTGHGISGEEVDAIFRPFYSTKESGFGMGLPLVKQIITEHLGEMVLNSRPGQGTTFQMYFPVRWKEGSLYRDHAPATAGNS
jgi:signal transduction histidine kinase